MNAQNGLDILFYILVFVRSGQETTLGVTRLKDTGHLDNCEWAIMAISVDKHFLVICNLFPSLTGPLLHGRPWQRERLGSSPHSSIDLEWENEVGTFLSRVLYCHFGSAFSRFCASLGHL